MWITLVARVCIWCIITELLNKYYVHMINRAKFEIEYFPAKKLVVVDHSKTTERITAIFFILAVVAIIAFFSVLSLW